VEAGFDAIDLGEADEAQISALRTAGLRVGTCDVLSMGDLYSSDAAVRKDCVQRNTDYIKKLTGLGVDRLFTAVIAKDPAAPRKENYDLAVATLSELAPVAARHGAKIVIEGWPGMDPYYPNLCCNPETYRQILKDVNSPGLGVNYDPSHLIRMGIDHIRFLEEFLPHVGHVHAKDTEIRTEALYEYGCQQASAFVPWTDFGESYWRYTIPGHGQARWVRIFELLAAAKWEGIVSVELEDDNFRGNEEAERLGFTNSLVFLQTA
jgi:sugar phosphate isomerase/epimerase